MPCVSENHVQNLVVSGKDGALVHERKIILMAAIAATCSAVLQSQAACINDTGTPNKANCLALQT